MTKIEKEELEAKGIKKIQFIIIITIKLTKFTYLNSPKIIKYPMLIITGETINIIELRINKYFIA